MISVPNMLMIGSAARKIGKTELACRLIVRLREVHDVIGIKVTTVLETDGECPRGGEGCGACTSFDGEFEMTQEVPTGLKGKDTVRMLEAGAARVLWLRSLKEHLGNAISTLLETVDRGAALVCESNSLRTVVEPGLFIMVEDASPGMYKQSAADVKHHADRTIRFDGERFDFDEEGITFADGVWAIKEDAAAIIMAGGKSSRMGRDKCLLPIDGRPMIQYIADRLRPHFARLVVSANGAGRYPFLELDVVPDRIPGRGPLMGLASALEASRHDLNLVIACDVPGFDIAFVRRMLRESEGYEGVVPVTEEGHLEPMCAVYRKEVASALNEAIASGEKKIKDALTRCRINYIEASDPAPFRNINTVDDYEEYIAARSGREQERESI
jgi:molybdenum cofactor guanylyltransferase